MLCAVALIGAGYAAFAPGTAKTYNDNNSVDVGYMTLTPTGEAQHEWDAITASKVAATLFDSYTYDRSGTKTAYYFAAGQAEQDPVTADTHTYSVSKVGTKVFVLDNQTGGVINALKIKVRQSVAVGNADYVYILSIGTVNHVLSATTDGYVTDFDLTNVAAGTTNLTVNLYIGYEADVYLPVSDGNGFKTGPAITKATYDGYVADANDDSEDNYDEAAKESTSLKPLDINDLDLAFIAGVWNN